MHALIEYLNHFDRTPLKLETMLMVDGLTDDVIDRILAIADNHRVTNCIPGESSEHTRLVVRAQIGAWLEGYDYAKGEVIAQAKIDLSTYTHKGLTNHRNTETHENNPRNMPKA